MTSGVGTEVNVGGSVGDSVGVGVSVSVGAAVLVKEGNKVGVALTVTSDVGVGVSEGWDKAFAQELKDKHMMHIIAKRPVRITSSRVIYTSMPSRHPTTFSHVQTYSGFPKSSRNPLRFQSGQSVRPSIGSPVPPRAAQPSCDNITISSSGS